MLVLLPLHMPAWLSYRGSRGPHSMWMFRWRMFSTASPLDLHRSSVLHSISLERERETEVSSFNHLFWPSTYSSHIFYDLSECYAVFRYVIAPRLTPCDAKFYPDPLRLWPTSHGYAEGPMTGEGETKLVHQAKYRMPPTAPSILSSKDLQT